MGRIEEAMLESLVALSASEPEGERHMFVVTASPATAALVFEGAGVRTMRAGEVLMACRSADPPLGATHEPLMPGRFRRE